MSSITRLAVLLFVLLVPSVVAGKPTIAWNSSSISEVVLIGTTQTVQVSFVSSNPLSNVVLRTVPGLQPFVSISPSEFGSIPSGIPQTITIAFSIPKTTLVKTLNGTIQLRDRTGTISSTLPLTLNITAANATDIPTSVATPSADRIITDPFLGGASYVNDEIDITFARGTDETTIHNVVSQVNGVFLGSIPEIPTYQVLVQETGFDNLLTIIHQVEENPSVLFATHNFTFNLQSTPNDPRFGDQDYLTVSNVPSAWNIKTGGSNVSIGVIDDGFDSTHEDLRGNVTINTGPIPFSHGTSVAGILAAKGNNSIGIAGTMWDASLRLYSAADPTTGKIFLGNVLREGVHAMSDRVKVINVSLGYACFPCTSQELQTLVETDKAFAGLIGRAKTMGADILWVFPAGNKEENHPANNQIDVSNVSPARLSNIYSNVVTVAATTRPGGSLATFSNYGNGVTVAAPGVNMLTTGLNNSYVSQSGTSGSAPLVAGVAGLIQSVNSNLNAAVEKVIIKYTSDDTGSSDPAGNKIFLLNAFHAVQSAQAAFLFPDGSGSYAVKIDYPASRLPDSFPSDLPLEDFGDPVTQNFVAAITDGRFQQSRVYTTTKTLVNVIDVYQNYFLSHGWTVHRFSFPNLEGVFATNSANSIPSMQITANENTITHIREVQMHFSSHLD